MTNIENPFQLRIINVIVDGVRKSMSFQEIEQLLIQKGKPTFFNIGNNKSPFSIDSSVESFAQKFTVSFYPDYAHRAFKLNIEYNGATFWEVPVMTKAMMFNLTSPALCQ
jgi:hypothetical protein